MVRREPFAVVLFDEIEKAHPAFFDLLLGVMGDARLTDARGQTVDFTNTIIIMTSNLGAQENATDLGFRQTNQSDASVYRQAAEKFFKPEFFNRVTRVVPFERLRREDVREIAERLIQDIFSREGLTRRGVKLIVETEALNLLVQAGYHPQLGARALKRTLERQVTAPIAARLSATTPDQPLIIFLHAREGSIAVDVSHLAIVDDGAPLMRVPLVDTHELLDGVEDALERIEADAEELRPQGEIIIGDNAASQLQHFYVREQARRVARMLDRADERVARQRSGSARAKPLQVSSKSKRQLAKLDAGDLDDSLFRQNLYRFLQDCASQCVPYGDLIDDYLHDIICEAALLEALWTTLRDSAPAKTLMTIASLDEQGRTARIRLRDLYRSLFEREFSCTTALKEEGHVELLSIDGPIASVLAPLEAGTHLFVSANEAYVPVIVSSPASKPGSLPSVLRIYSDQGATLDIRSRLLARAKLGNAELRAFILSALQPPLELTG